MFLKYIRVFDSTRNPVLTYLNLRVFQKMRLVRGLFETVCYNCGLNKFFFFDSLT